jgi:hypothetical protein
MGESVAALSVELAAAAEAVRLEHQRLDDHLATLLAARDLQSLTAVLDRLSSALSAHFLHEESPRGAFEILAECLPSSRNRVQRFVEDHDRMLVLARGLAARARALADRERDIYEEAVRFIERLHEHETLEDILMDETQRSSVSGL